MSSLLRYALTTVLLAALGFGAWRAGGLQQRAAEAHRQLLTLEFEAPAATVAAIEKDLSYVQALPGFASMTNGLREQRVASSYWRGRYDELALPTSATGEITETNRTALLFSANAAYRSAGIDESSPAAVQRMEGLMARYADVLRRSDWQYDAAYNYEFVARRRDALIRARGRGQQKRAADEPSSGAPSTIHGRAGAVPPGTDMQEFKVVVPQRSDERREQPEAGKGGPKARKG